MFELKSELKDGERRNELTILSKTINLSEHPIVFTGLAFGLFVGFLYAFGYAFIILFEFVSKFPLFSVASMAADFVLHFFAFLSIFFALGLIKYAVTGSARPFMELTIDTPDE